jgi:acetolactate synthase-1/2/3 large subunit
VSTCGEAVVSLLEQYGVRTVFGIPGVHTLELYRGLAHASMRHVTCRHEQGAGFMADGWARVQGEPGVCILIGGPGVTNAATPVAQAFHDSRPLLIISGAVPSDQLGKGHGNIHDLPDQRKLMAQITAFSHTLLDPAELPKVFARAFEVFSAHRPRPVHIGIPVDVLAREMDHPKRLPSDVLPPEADDRLVAAAADHLAAATTRFVVLGGGATDAAAGAIQIAELLDAPIGLSINGKGIVMPDHPLYVGPTLGFPPVCDLLQESEAVLVVGAELSDLDLWALPEPLALRGSLVRIDIDADQAVKRPETTIGIVGDAAATLRALFEALQGRAGVPTGGRERARSARKGLRWPPEIVAFRRLLDTLDDELPPNRVVVGDSTQPVYAANHYLPARAPRSWVMPIGYGTLGCALPMAIGAKLAAPNRPVVCIAGDGGFLFTVQELATARDLRLPLPIVLWNNNGYGEIRESMARAGVPQIGTETSAYDFPAIAEGFGCSGRRARDLDELRVLLRSALGGEHPTLIEVRPDVL